MKGEHTIRVTADMSGIVAESNETNNVATLTLIIKGNEAEEGSSFAQASQSSSALSEFFALLIIEEDGLISPSADETAFTEPPPAGLYPASVDALFAQTEPDESLVLSRSEEDPLFEDPLMVDLLAV